MKEISFIHAADLHLDTPFQGLVHLPDNLFEQIRESTFEAFERLITLAIQEKVDFVLLVGDLFDHERRSLKAQVRLRNGFKQLEEHQIMAYVSYGNHDFMRGNTRPIHYPENVVVFPDERVRHVVYKKNKEPLATIYGFSYENRALFDHKALEFTVSNTNTPFHIAMLHGSLATNTEHDVYAPFHLSDLLKEPFDYWALGHIHKRQLLKEEPPIVYPGNIQGRNRKEMGEKGCYLVKLTSLGADLSFQPLQSIIFEKMNIHIDDSIEMHELYERINSKITEEFQHHLPYFIDLTIISNQEDLVAWKLNNELQEMIELINEQHVDQIHWRYIFHWQIIGNESIPLWKEGSQFLEQLEEVATDISIKKYLKPLYAHREGRKYINFPSEKEQETLKKLAKEYLYFTYNHQKK